MALLQLPIQLHGYYISHCQWVHRYRSSAPPIYFHALSLPLLPNRYLSMGLHVRQLERPLTWIAVTFPNDVTL